MTKNYENIYNPSCIGQGFGKEYSAEDLYLLGGGKVDLSICMIYGTLADLNNVIIYSSIK